MSIPDIKIKYGRLLDPIFIEYCKHHPGWKDWIPPSPEVLSERIRAYKKEWDLCGINILDGLQSVTDIQFKQNIIKVYIVSGNPRQLSNPIIIKSGYTPSEFVGVLTHELIHELFSENIDRVYPTIFKDMFPRENAGVRSHVLVHALLKYVYLDIIGNTVMLGVNIESSRKHSSRDYIRAWDLVEVLGYKDLINSFKLQMKKGGSCMI